MGTSEPILPLRDSVKAPRPWGRIAVVVVALLVSGLWLTGCPHRLRTAAPHRLQTVAQAAQGCDQADALYPDLNTTKLLEGKEDDIIAWLSGAVKVPTEVFDDMGEIGDDPRWDIYYAFHDYLKTAFPLVHAHLSLTRVHTHGLVYEWVGSGEHKPLLLAAHYDVVPVLLETRDQWTHDPYGGEFDGKRIWGRGATDDKSGLIGSLAAVELLLDAGFTPARTVILAFGYDEEASGSGAGHINDWLLDKYGSDSIALIVDEGNGLSSVYGQMFAAPAVAEKGYLDAEVRVETPGGHSSVPPDHTGIGLMSLILAELEAHPYAPDLSADSPLVDFVACAARFAPDTPKHLIKEVGALIASRSRGKVDKKALKKVEHWWDSPESVDAGFSPPGAGRALISTTQAIDIIHGGVKVNALPEVVTAVVNHRISISSGVKQVQDRMTDILTPLAIKHGLQVDAWGEKFGKNVKGKLVLAVAWNATIETAPISPFTVESPAWRLLAGTVKGTWATRPGAHGDDIHMAPLMSTGNTDTKNYWNLTRNIYRFAYLTTSGGLNNAHTVNEFIDADVFVEQVRWFANLILNVDKSRDI